jgi:hypothetical protein
MEAMSKMDNINRSNIVLALLTIVMVIGVTTGVTQAISSIQHIY